MDSRRKMTLFFADAGTDDTRVEIGFHFGRQRQYRATVSSQTSALTRSGDALFCLGLLPAMELGVDLEIDADVDGRLLANANLLQDIYLKWHPYMQPIQITAPNTVRQFAPNRKTALNFSGGVDSSYSLLTYPKPIDAIVTIFGGDISADDIFRTERMQQRSRAVAQALGIEAIHLNTNITSITQKMTPYNDYHGAFFAGLRHFLADDIEHLIIGASDTEISLERAWGSHPLVDPLYGYEGASIAHDGFVDRFTKVARCAQSGLILHQLRVCNERVEDVENCGRCYKCGFVMAALDCLGLRGDVSNFPWEHLEQVPLKNVGLEQTGDFVRLQEEAVKVGGQDALVAKINQLLNAPPRPNSFAGVRRRWQRKKRRMRFL